MTKIGFGLIRLSIVFVLIFVAYLFVGQLKIAQAHYPDNFSIEVYFCESNPGTDWEVKYKFIYADGSSSSYFSVYTQVQPNNAPCPNRDIGGRLHFGVFLTGDPKILWWTQCHDPFENPEKIFQGVHAMLFRTDVTFSGGDNLGVVPATDPSGSSCPVGGPAPPAPTNFTGSCSGTTGSNSWSPSSGASSYVIINGITNPPENGSYTSQNTSGTSVNWTGLSPGTTYYQRVNAVSSSGKWSSPVYTSFTCAQPPPGAPSLNSPIDNTVVGSCPFDGTVTFSWNLGANATTHELHLDGDNQLDGVDQYIPLNVDNQTSNTQTGLLPSRFYQWRIRAFNSGGFTDSTGNGTFQTPNCPEPTLPPAPAPTVDVTADGFQGPITVNSGSSVTLRWTTTNSPTACNASGAWSGAKATGGGSESRVVSSNSTFTIACSNSSGSGSDSVTVNVTAATSPPVVCAGSVSGSKWSDTDNKLFDTANGLPGSTVRLDGGVQTDGPQTADYSFSNVFCSNHTVAVDGVSGWAVKWCISGLGCGAESAAGSGTSVTFSISTNGQNVAPWFYFRKVAGLPPPSAPPGTISLSGSSTCSGSDAVVSLSWSAPTGAGPFWILRDSLIVDNSNIAGTSWVSPPQTQGETHGWQVYGTGTNTYSNTATVTTATCGAAVASPTPPAATPPPIIIGPITVTIVCVNGTDIRADLTWDAAPGYSGNYDVEWYRTSSSSRLGIVTTPNTFAQVPTTGTLTANTGHNFFVYYIKNGVRTTWARAFGVNSDSPCGPTTGTISGSKLTDGGIPFKTPSYPGATVTVDRTSVSGTSADTYSRTVSGGTHTVTVSGASGWRVQWCWTGHGCGAFSAAGAGTAVNVSVVAGTDEFVHFFFSQVVASSPLPADLTIDSISFDKDPFASYLPSETVTVTSIVVRNLGGQTANNVNVRFFDNLVGAPSCSTAPITNQTNLATVAAGGTTSWGSFTFTAPATGGSKSAWAIVGCGAPPDGNPANDTRSKLYSVVSNAWFETQGGDVGAAGAIDVSTTPPAGRFQSDYLTVAKSAIDAEVKSKPGWRITNYPGSLLPSGSVYQYLAERFLGKATSTNCGIAGRRDGLFRCSTRDVTINAGSLSGNSVWFIDGNLTVSTNLALASGDTATFIVAGNITINTSTTRADGIYIAGGTFADVTDAATLAGPQLVINGAVYANSANMARVLGGSCGAICNNATDPAERLILDLKYLVGLNSVLGSPSISWKEVAP